MEDFLKLLEFESKEINHLFEKASIEGKGTPQEVSDRRETAVKKFLEKYFPFPYRIAKGNIIDSYGKRSNSIDCIILNPSHPYTVSDDEKYSIIFADGVDIAIEVKPDLSKESEIERSLSQIASVKRLRRKRNGLLLKSKFSDGAYSNSYTIPTFIFGNKTYKNIKLLVEKIVNYYTKNGTPKNEQFDFLVVNNELVLFNSKKDSYFTLPNGVEGICYLELGDKTLPFFLMYLNGLPQSAPRMNSTVLEHYFNFDSMNYKGFTDLNKKLLEIKST